MKMRYKIRQSLEIWVFLNTVFLCLFQAPAILTSPVPPSLVTKIFYGFCLIAQNFLFAGLLGLILWPFLLQKFKSVKIIVSILLTAAIQIFCFVNAKVFAFWHLYINTTLLHLFFYGGQQVFEVRYTLYIWIAAVIVLFLIFSILFFFLWRRLHLQTKFNNGLIVVTTIYVLSQSLFLFFSYQQDNNFLQYTLKIPYFYDLSWVNILEKMHWRVVPKQSSMGQLQTVLNENKKLDYPLHPLQYHLPPHPLNVLFIVIDTLRYDMINPVNMPHVYQFSKQANQFLDNLSGGDCTRPGIFSLFYSIPPSYWYAAKKNLQGSILIRAFQHNHYQLGIFASAPLYSPAFDKTVFVTVKKLQSSTPGDTALDRDAYITQETEHFLNHAQQSARPFFAFVFYDAPHAYNSLTLKKPFSPIGYLNYFDIHNDTPPSPMFNLYKNAVFADDQLVEKVIMTLKQDHLEKNTVVIITADHGQEFNDYHNNYWEHASGFSQYQMRTPMLILWPGQQPKMVHEQTSHYDLAPTLLKRVLGVTNPTRDYSVGNDFFTSKQQDFVIAGNYGYYALIGKNDIIQFHESGLYRVTNMKMDALPNKEMDPAYFSPVVKQMASFYASSTPDDKP